MDSLDASAEVYFMAEGIRSDETASDMLHL